MLVSALAISIAGACAAEPEQVLYVSVGGEARVATYRIDASTGWLIPGMSIAVGPKPGALAISARHRVLYASHEGEQTLSILSIASADGALSRVADVDLGGTAIDLTLDRTESLLLASYLHGPGGVSLHAIGDEGLVDAKADQRIETKVFAHSVRVDRSNRFVFVSHSFPNEIRQFLLEIGRRRLEANRPAGVSPAGNQGPRHLEPHPRLDVVYTANEQGSSVSVWALDPARGTLREVQTSSTLPEGFGEKNLCADVHVTPDGRFVYVSNRGHESLAGFAVDASTGRLESIGHFATEAVPRSFAIDATGRFLYAAGQRTGRIAAFRIDRESGALLRFATFEVGKGPAWVLAHRLDSR